MSIAQGRTRHFRDQLTWNGPESLSLAFLYLARPPLRSLVSRGHLGNYTNALSHETVIAKQQPAQSMLGPVLPSGQCEGSDGQGLPHEALWHNGIFLPDLYVK